MYRDNPDTYFSKSTIAKQKDHETYQSYPLTISKEIKRKQDGHFGTKYLSKNLPRKQRLKIE